VEPTVNFIREGKGAPVILIYGLAGSIPDWADLYPALVSAGYSVFALDLLGHGRSFRPKKLDQYPVDQVFEHLVSWIATHHLDQPLILVGHSLGGCLSIEYASRYPEKVRALVLADTLYTLDHPPLAAFPFQTPLY